MRSRLTILGASLLLALATPGAQAQAPYPERTVHLVVPNPPGGVTDLLARIIAQRLSQTWGQAVVVDNRPGGDETIAADSVARAAPDGHTLFVASGAPLVFETNSLEPIDMSAPAFAAFLRRDYDQQGALIKMVGLGE